LGKIYRGEPLEITAVDPLADVYDAILRDAKIRPLIPTTWCHGELLEERFALNTFDLVYAQNALDHSYDPFRIIVSMIRLTKPGQFVMLEHRQDEAERARYTGLHQWNFALREGNFIIWNPSYVVNVTDILRNFVTIDNEFNPEVDWLVTKIQKHSDPPMGLGIADSVPTRHGWPWLRKGNTNFEV
jgi:ubiquinone/menaquinone biosynthesis C-methylase UbiE